MGGAHGVPLEKSDRRMGLRRRMAGFLVILAAMALLLSVVSAAPGLTGSAALTPRQRFGFVAVKNNWQQTFDVAQLSAGWYVDVTRPTCDRAPEGMERAQVLKVHSGYTIPAWLGPHVDNHPGTMWLIGNEPDCIWQDNVLPEEYAHIYYDLYTFIESRDPTSQVSPGGIVQPTPLRLEWLDRALAEYDVAYGGLMPVDIWNIHNAILNEQRGIWGAEIPPGIEADEGEIRSVDDNDNMTLFVAQIEAFRQWMVTKGYGGYPLIITEYGILMPDDYGFHTTRVNAFMSNTFAYLTTAVDTELGDPNDDHRLVQRWAWFSLAVQPWDPITGLGFNGNLFDPDTKAITAHGLHYADWTSSFPPLDYTDLVPGAFVPAAFDPISPTQLISRPILVEIQNAGTVDSGSFTLTLAYDDPPVGPLVQMVSNVPPASSQWALFTLTNLLPGRHDVSVWVDPDNRVEESIHCNNQRTGVVLAPIDRVYLPLAPRSGTGTAPSGSIQAYRELDLAQGMEPSNVDSGFQEFEVPTPDSYPAQIALDGQGGVWITEYEGNKIARFDPQTKDWHEYPIDTPNSKPWGLDVDGDGNVWFAETEADQIGKLIVASGTISEFETLTDSSQPWGVAVGSGAVWFTERQANKIGKLVMASGTITECEVPTDNAEPMGLDVSNKYVWFAETAADKLGRLVIPGCSIYEHVAITRTLPLQVPLDGPLDVVVASSGNPWFTEMDGDRITLFYVSTLDEFSQVPVHTPNSEPFGITMEGDVAVWFTEKAASKLGRFTGDVPPAEYRLPSWNSYPTDVVVDSSGCAWYTAPGVNRIGRLCLPVHYRVHLPLVTRSYGGP